ncbi:hypothetical protein B9Q11_00515 [Candidatus Marsarchaeota G2 archaeon ECH_B_SAG-F08]|jgi:oligopeptide/dipeptide ABC transporter ATP-binding protein|uniref:ABC transporter domain-containing protein n=6 Tax=Candidatus Marsarchaeota TaxID=1978152 RepID=A0A2R6AH78_9ARCH|nr:MAG: hypothetical protein B9Q01_08110 [Candidatus Marsarchaeota G1 archaeon OSP_D]PSN85752.1 MAG: hypothetical protein B9Q02_05145 [Candidatus Marsarchaeota G1 archaeon BE_D]PSN87275.1 MAG: hypothetical protein B9Q00_09300 [Candidatus Marsarchaeota G1 archaeon OSP_C]PSN99805.1 MAG: hypothetical protein B9Q11_00515 [Candidatus Marsarchaeota G2 archaeon ECH_B_SAG-F08]PSO01943.1 MAG: hypothetical protein B9Q10_01880 [Candidatus Marsarchaeota G2 archaeon ECH_B_SAG-E12]PSO05701.1 MAG: hypothetic
MTTKILEVNDLRVHFRLGGFWGKRAVIRAVDGISFFVNEGETLGVAGETGSGKSTIAKVLVGLYKPTSGTVKLMGEVINFRDGNSVAKLRENVGIVFQDPTSSLNPRLKVREIIREALVAAGVERSLHEERIRHIVPLVGLRPSVLDAYPRQLSGGEKQRVSLARALVVPKKLLILDEPTSSLDVSVQAQVLNTLKELKKELKLSYLFISHDLNVLKYMSTRILVLFYGKMVEIGSARKIVTEPKHPYTQELVSNLLDSPQPLSERLVMEHQPSFTGCVYSRICPFVMEECRTTHPPFYKVSDDQFVACHLFKKFPKAFDF